MITASLATICLYAESTTVSLTILFPVLLLFSHKVVADCDPMDCSIPGSLAFTISQSLLKPMSLSRWCHPTISSSVPRFSPCPQSFPGSGSSSMSWLLASGGQSTLFLLFPMLCTKSAWLTYFITGNLYHFIPSTNFPYLHTSLPFSNYNLFSVSMSLFLLCFVCLFLFVNSACKWHHMEVVFICLFHSA